MARAHGGRQSVTQLDDSGGTLRNISLDVTSVDAPTNTDTADVSGMTETRKSFIQGQIDTPISLSGNFNDGTAAIDAHNVISGVVGGTTLLTFEHYPAGSASGKPKLSGEVICDSYSVAAPVAGAVTWSATLKPANSTGLVWSTV